MVGLRRDGRPGFRYHLKVHSFRTFTAILAWVLMVVAFYEKPELLTGGQRSLQRGIEAVGDAIPPPWGPRIEFVFREIGGLIWLQITPAHSPSVSGFQRSRNFAGWPRVGAGRFTAIPRGKDPHPWNFVTQGFSTSSRLRRW
jgi:hypothetical protein